MTDLVEIGGGLEGTQIGPYRVLGNLGSGGMGKVYLVEVSGQASGLLDYRVEHAPTEYRESMLTNVKLHREIMEAWAEYEGTGLSE